MSRYACHKCSMLISVHSGMPDACSRPQSQRCLPYCDPAHPKSMTARRRVTWDEEDRAGASRLGCKKKARHYEILNYKMHLRADKVCNKRRPWRCHADSLCSHSELSHRHTLPTLTHRLRYALCNGHKSSIQAAHRAPVAHRRTRGRARTHAPAGMAACAHACTMPPWCQ
jgi:hypothetical protein